MAQDDNRDSGLGFFSGLIIGGLVGAFFAIVLAPQSGEETRDLIRGRAHEAKNRAIDLAYDLKDRAATMADDLRAQAEQLSDIGRQAFDTTRARINEAMDAGRKAAQSKTDELSEEG
ncbi:MAG TPA: YtxH domain-containing protein [Candidatus Eremiobacteraceae bacterium]|nr:YtxH domain-containing protein [Candidatus Eremiobacteraceae bacterium]